jgi:hypothetical protein
MNSDKIFSSLASAIGIGMIAGLAGTLAITISQMIEMKITKRSMSKAPAHPFQFSCGEK